MKLLDTVLKDSVLDFVQRGIYTMMNSQWLEDMSDCMSELSVAVLRKNRQSSEIKT